MFIHWPPPLQVQQSVQEGKTVPHPMCTTARTLFSCFPKSNLGLASQSIMGQGECKSIVNIPAVSILLGGNLKLI